MGLWTEIHNIWRFQVAPSIPLHRFTLCLHTTRSCMRHNEQRLFSNCCPWYGSLVCDCGFVLESASTHKHNAHTNPIDWFANTFCFVSFCFVLIARWRNGALWAYRLIELMVITRLYRRAFVCVERVVCWSNKSPAKCICICNAKSQLKTVIGYDFKQLLFYFVCAHALP